MVTPSKAGSLYVYEYYVNNLSLRGARGELQYMEAKDAAYPDREERIAILERLIDTRAAQEWREMATIWS